MPAAVAIPAAASLAGAGINFLGSKSQADSARTASDRAESARQDAMGAVGDDRIMQLGSMLFPGLFAPGGQAGGGGMPGGGGFGGSMGMPGYGQTPNYGNMNMGAQPGGYSPGPVAGYLAQNPQAMGQLNYPTYSNFMDPRGMQYGMDSIEGRAGGGPVAPNQTVMVGEQGPELMQAGQGGGVVTPIQGIGQQPGPGTEQPTPMPQPQPGPQQPGPGGPITQGLDPGVMPGWPGMPQQQQQDPSFGGLATQQNYGLLQNPGQTSTVQYERAQEGANRGLNTALMGIQGSLTGRGIDPSSGMGTQMTQQAVLNQSFARNEALRNQALLEEQLRRQDIEQGTQAYINMLQMIFGGLGMKGSAAGGNAFPQVAPVNPYGNLGTGVASAGKVMGDYYANQNNAAVPQPTGQGQQGTQWGSGPAYAQNFLWNQALT